jgi:hypothetical protein
MPEKMVRLVPTNEPCWRCGGDLDRVDPPLDGWEYHCQKCQHLTSPGSKLKAAMAGKPKESAGIVAAVKCEIRRV